MSVDPAWSRRAVLAGGLAVAVTACTSSGSDGGSPDGSASTTAASTPSTTGRPAEIVDAEGNTIGEAARPARFTAEDFDALGSCPMTPEQTAGPFPLDEQFERTDITEGSPGTPLRLGFRVVGPGCAPMYPAAVEVWHADATGDYSAFTDGGGGKDEAEGTTFLRGTQQVTNDGIAQFETIYPGWYTGRAVHVHVRVRYEDQVLLTSQVYFHEAVTRHVYRDAPYAEFGMPDTDWTSDAIAGDPAKDGTALALNVIGDHVTGLINLAIPV